MPGVFQRVISVTARFHFILAFVHHIAILVEKSGEIIAILLAHDNRNFGETILSIFRGYARNLAAITRRLLRRYANIRTTKHTGPTIHRHTANVAARPLNAFYMQVKPVRG